MLALCGGALRLPGPRPSSRVIGSREGTIIDLLGEALWPEGNAIGVPWVGADAVDSVLADILLPASVIPFRYSLFGLDYAARVSGSSLAAMDEAERIDLLRQWSEGTLPQRLSHDGVKAVLGLAYFNHPDVLEAVGFNLRCAWAE